MVVTLKGRDEDVPEGSWRDEYFLKDPHWLVSNIEFTSSTYDSIGASFLKRCIFFSKRFSLCEIVGLFSRRVSSYLQIILHCQPPSRITNKFGQSQPNRQHHRIIHDCWVKSAPPKKNNPVMYCEAGVKQWSATLLRPTPKGWNRVHWGNDFWGLKD